MRRKRSDVKVLIIAWAPAHEGQRPLDATTYCGARLHELAGKPLAHFAAVESLNDHPVTPENPPPETELHRRATEILQAYPLLPVLAVGRDTCRSLGLDNELGRVGYLTWFNTGQRLCAVMPHPSARNAWWSRPENVEAARLFLRAISEARPLVPYLTAEARTRSTWTSWSTSVRCSRRRSRTRRTTSASASRRWSGGSETRISARRGIAGRGAREIRCAGPGCARRCPGAQTGSATPRCSGTSPRCSSVSA